MDDFEWQKIEELGVLKWNIAEDITDIEEQNYEKDKNRSILEVIFPPKTLMKNNKKHGTRMFRQTISRKLPSQGNLSKMIQIFEDCELFLKFKNQGVCDSRHALYNLFFDELLRQIIIADEEIGKIIYRIHKEFENLIFTYKYILEKGAVFDLDMDEETEDPEVKDLIMINEDLKTKCDNASQKYFETLRQKELNENINYLTWLEDNHKNLVLKIEKSTEQLQEQLNIMSVPETIATLT